MENQIGNVQISTPEQFFGGNGSMIQKLRANSWDLDCLRTNATLPHDAWKAIDDTVQEVAEQRLNAMADLRSRGLVYPVKGGLGALYVYWQTMSEGGDAEQSMSGITAGARSNVDFGEKTIPMPITHVDFTVSIRKLMAMDNSPYGGDFDTTMVAQATRKVIEKLEYTMFYGSPVVIGGNSLYGYMDYPHSNALTTLTGNWTGTIANCETDVVKLIAEAESHHHYGPFTLYVHSNEWTDLRQRWTYQDLTYLDIIKNMSGIDDVKSSDQMTANDIVLVEMSRETVDLAVAVDLKVVEWPTHGGMQSNFKVMAVIAPRVKSDYDDNCGVVYDTDIGSS